VAGALSYQADGMGFSAALCIRNGARKVTPLVPLSCKTEGDLSTTIDGKGQTRHYAAIEGAEFVVLVKQMTDANSAEYGFKVFFDQGQNPPKDSWDHFRWWGKDPSGPNRTLQIDGMYESPTSSYTLKFKRATASSSSATASSVPHGSSRKRKESGDGAVVIGDDCDDGAPKLGWIVVRYFRVSGWRKATSGFETDKRTRKLNGREKPALTGEVGVIRMDKGAYHYANEPIFEEEAVFESRIHYNKFDSIRYGIVHSSHGAVLSDPTFFRGIPLMDLLNDVQTREYLRGRMLTNAQKNVKGYNSDKPGSGNPSVMIVDVLRQINMHFDEVASRILCSSSADLKQNGALAKLAAKQLAQGEPCLIENLEQPGDEPEQHFSPQGFFGKKLNGLREEMERRIDKYQLTILSDAEAPSGAMTVSSASSTALFVKHHVEDLG
jgi:hypothetical protein